MSKKEVFEIDKYIFVPKSFQKCSVCQKYHSPQGYVNSEGKKRTNCVECYNMDWDEMIELKEKSIKIEAENFKLFREEKCVVCEERKKASDIYNIDPCVCNSCEEGLENISGYCSMSCRLTGICDNSC